MNGQSNEAKIAVIIPYFQRKSGLLKKAVTSILNQADVDKIQIFVVDDCSPIPAVDELSSLLTETDRITIIEQDNAGPGAARNNGLDNMPESIEYVAFIDSDDWWDENFLQHALSAMEQGCELFFANSKRFAFDETRFDWYAEKNLNLVAKEHQILDPSKELYQFKGCFFDYSLVRSNIISTSALVYRLAAYPTLRFNTKLFNGQDRLFKMMLAQHVEHVAFCPKVLVFEEEGINIFDSAKWGTTQSLIKLVSYIKLTKCILAELELKDEQRSIIIKQLNDSRFSFTANILHLLKKRIKIDVKLVKSAIYTDPKLALLFIPHVFKLIFK